MRKKPILDYACPENWESMIAVNEKAKFCDKCNVTLVDFTSMSDKELQEYLRSGEYLCGRIKATQLDDFNVVHKLILELKFRIEEKTKSVFGRLFVLLLGGLLMLSGCKRKVVCAGFVKSNEVVEELNQHT